MSVKIFDTNEHFYLLHFDDYSQELDNYRGMIIERTADINTDNEGSVLPDNNLNKYLVCRSFPFTPEYDYSTSKEVFDNLIEYSKVYPSYEGSVLRLFNWNNEWFLSTHKKINAFNSRWGSSKSFGDMFLEQLGISDLQDVNKLELNKSKVYTFLLRTNMENRIVCLYDDLKLFYIGSFDRQRDFVYENDTFPRVDNIPDIKYAVNTYEQMVEYITKSDEYKEQGVVLVTQNGRSVKFLNTKYTELFQLRHNETNIIKAYIMNLQEGTHEQFLNLYEEHIEKFRHFDRAFSNIVFNIYRNYISRYIKNNVAIVPPEQYNIMKSIYEQYLKRNSEYSYITRNLVTKHVLEQDYNVIYNLYHLYSNRENLYGNGNKVEEHIKNKILI